MLNMKLFKNYIAMTIIGLSVVTVQSQSFAAAAQCNQLFESKAIQPYQEHFQASQESTNLLYKIFKKTTSNPTNRRKETKNTLRTSTYQKIYDRLSLNLASEGMTIGIRDTVVKGFRNVTKTLYSRQIRFSAESALRAGFRQDQEVRGVIRQRKYGQVKNDQAVKLENMITSDFTQDYSFFEVKFKDPEFENSVLKPRAYMADATYKRIISEKLTESEKNKILAEILSLKPNKSLTHEEVSTFVELIISLKDSNFNFEPVLVSFYNRVSKFVRFMSQTTQNIFEIQITEDTFVSAYRRTTNDKYELVNAHNDDTVVIETKVPVDQIGLVLPNPKADYRDQKSLIQKLADVPGYQYFLQFQSDLLASHVYSAIVNDQVINYTPNTGKKGLLQSVKANSKTEQENLDLAP